MKIIKKQPIPIKLFNNNNDYSNMINRTSFTQSLIFLTFLSYPLIDKKWDKRQEFKQIEIFKKTSKSVCFISTEYTTLASNLKMDSENLPKGVGTGFIWDREGHIVTNFHVINKVNNAMVTINNKTYSAKITGIEPEKDIAVLKIDTNNTSELPYPITIGNVNDIMIGQYSYAIGNPFGQDHTFTMGIISGKNREMTSPTGRIIKDIIQTDTAINPGNSGGPLLNSNGEIIGMNTASFGTGVSSGVGFALPIDMISKVVKEIIEYGSVQKAIIGISFLERLPTAFESKEMNISVFKKGVMILSVPSNSTTGLIGIKKINNTKIKVGDVILAIDDYEINDPQDLATILEKYKPNDKVKLKIIREGKEIIKEITLTTYKTESYTNMQIDIPLKNIAPQIKPKM
jgi:S1-C subfamily serine protease